MENYVIGQQMEPSLFADNASNVKSSKLAVVESQSKMKGLSFDSSASYRLIENAHALDNGAEPKTLSDPTDYLKAKNCMNAKKEVTEIHTDFSHNLPSEEEVKALNEEDEYQYNLNSGKTGIEQNSIHFFHHIMVRVCVIKMHRNESEDAFLTGGEDDSSDSAILKVLYLQPCAGQSIQSSNPLPHCRKVIHEIPMNDLGRCQSSFLWNVQEKAIEQKILLHGYVGELLFSMYKIDRKTKQRHFFGQCIVPLRQYGCRINAVYPLYLRDGQTLLDAGIKIETEVFLPEKFKKELSLSNSSDSDNDENQSHSRNLFPSGKIRETYDRHWNSDVCVEVFERRQRDSQRRYEKQKYRLLQENEKLQKRLRDIALTKRNTYV